jgi:hypothetical protein
MALELVSREIAPQHVQLTFPFLDTELALFLLNLPRIVNRWPGETKTLLRRSMTGLVDQRILRRRDKANFRNALIEDLLRYDLPEILDTIRRGPLQQMGLIDPKRFEERLLNVRRNPPESLALWETVCIDLWLREVANGIRKRPGGDAEGGKKDIQHSRVEDGRAPNGDYQ